MKKLKIFTIEELDTEANERAQRYPPRSFEPNLVKGWIHAECKKKDLHPYVLSASENDTSFRLEYRISCGNIAQFARSMGIPATSIEGVANILRTWGVIVILQATCRIYGGEIHMNCYATANNDYTSVFAKAFEDTVRQIGEAILKTMRNYLSSERLYFVDGSEVPYAIAATATKK